MPPGPEPLVAVEQRHAFVATFFVCTIASCAYFAKCTGMGEPEIKGVKVPLARYVDWIATTQALESLAAAVRTKRAAGAKKQRVE